MADKALPCPTVLRLLLRYEPETGVMTWRKRAKCFCDTARRADWFNRRYAGAPALNARRKDGYLVGSVFDVRVRAHRAAWAIVHGAWPDEIDHINGDPSDNRLSNLRNVSHAGNQKNMKRPSNNTSGVSGVFWCTGMRRWDAEIHVGGRRVWLGGFETREQAMIARKAAEKVAGYHENHGRS